MHGANANAIVMRRPDGSPMTRQEVIVRRRGALKWLPVLCSNDLVHGSWWFTWGSFLMAIFSVYPLIQKYIGYYKQEDDLMPATDYDITWAMLIVCGVFFTLGSIAFVHAFEEPPKRAFFYWFKHAQTDELLGAWMFLFGTVPAVPYMLVFFSVEPSAFYFFGLLAAIVFVFASFLFVVSCYPSDKTHSNIVLPVCTGTFGAQMWVVKHLANDWLAGTWFFFWANALLTFASTVILFIAIGLGDPAQIFIWLSGTISSLFFLVGSAYFVSGSYPHASQFYYTTDRGQTDVTTTTEVFADEIGLAPAQRRESHTASILQHQLTQLGSTVTTTVTSTVVNPFHSATAEAERAKRQAGRRRSVYGGSVRGHSSPVPTGGQSSTLNPLQQALRQQLAAANAGVAMVNTMTRPTVPQQMDDRSDHGPPTAAAADPAAEKQGKEEQEDGEEEEAGGAPATAAPSNSSGYVKLVAHYENEPDHHSSDPAHAAPAAAAASGSHVLARTGSGTAAAFTEGSVGSAFVRSGVNRSGSGDNYKFTPASVSTSPAAAAAAAAAPGAGAPHVPAVAVPTVADYEEDEGDEEEGDDTPVDLK